MIKLYPPIKCGSWTLNNFRNAPVFIEHEECYLCNGHIHGKHAAIYISSKDEKRICKDCLERMYNIVNEVDKDG